MTNTTGPAQQRDQPTQLSPAEVVELSRLTRDLANAKFSLGLAIGIHGNSLKTDEAQEKSDAALLALCNWELAHGLTVDLLSEAQAGVTS